MQQQWRCLKKLKNSLTLGSFYTHTVYFIMALADFLQQTLALCTIWMQASILYSSCNIYLGILKIKIDPAALLLSSDPSIHEATTIVQNSWQNSGKVFAFVGCMRGGVQCLQILGLQNIILIGGGGELQTSFSSNHPGATHPILQIVLMHNS